MQRAWLRETAGLTDSFARAIIHAQLGEMDEAFAALDQAFQERHGALVWMDMFPGWEAFRSDPRYADYLARINRPPV